MSRVVASGLESARDRFTPARGHQKEIDLRFVCLADHPRWSSATPWNARRRQLDPSPMMTHGRASTVSTPPSTALQDPEAQAKGLIDPHR